MNLRHLQAFCEIVGHDFKISRAAVALNTSQPSVSRYIGGLEAEIGAVLFNRTEKRILGLTPAGEEVLKSARRLLQEADNIRKIGQDYKDESRGELTIGASHTTARYFLPKIVNEFIARHPNVRLVIRQSDPAHLVRLVMAGELDLAVSPGGSETLPEVAMIPCHVHGRLALTPPGHPLLRIRKPSLAQIATLPLITYSREFPAYEQIVRTFKKGGLMPNIVLTASDIDVMKTYVESGLGIAIVASFAFDPMRDLKLRAIDLDHLFAPARVFISLRKGKHIREFVYHFIDLVAPSLPDGAIEQAVFGRRPRKD